MTSSRVVGCHGDMAPCVFCEIVAGDRFADTVLDDDVAMGFLDNRPLFHGHVLLVPREHYETMPDLPPDLVGPLFGRARQLARAMETGLAATGSFVAVNNRVSQTVPHLHVHVVPRNRKDGLRGFFWPRHKYGSAEEAADVAKRLRVALVTEGP